MSVLEDFFDICIKMPNMDSFIFYTIFLIIVPITLGKINYTLLKLFLPLLVPISIILTQAGKPNMFNDLYPIEYTNISGFISKMIINLIAITNILYFSIKEGVDRNNLLYGQLMALTSIIIIFFLSRELIPLVIRRGDEYIRKNYNINLKYNWHKYLLGILVLILLIGLEVGIKELLIDLL